MRDGLRADFFEHLQYGIRIAHIDLVQSHACGNVVAVPSRQIVDHVRLMARGEEAVDDMAADETGTAGDDGTHESEPE